MQLSDLAQVAQEQIPWLWQGYLARGNFTLLTSQWKTGKTTLVSVLLHHLKAGGTLAGLPVQPGKTIVVSEEGPDLWFQRSRRFDYAEHVAWFCRPFWGKPTPEQWLIFVEQIAALHRQLGLSLLVIDPLAAFLPGRDENNAGSILAFLTPLQQLTSAGLAVLLLHHPRKQAAPEGQTARGSGALQGFADILLEMHWYNRADRTDRRRQLLAWSRFGTTPPELVIELNEGGTDYTTKGTREDLARAALHDGLYTILSAARGFLTVEEIEEQWPPDQPRPNSGALWRRLNTGIAQGWLRRTGAGQKGDPFRYWLVEREAAWRKNLRMNLELDDVDRRRELAELFGDV
jgi:hypothetical protein